MSANRLTQIPSDGNRRLLIVDDEKDYVESLVDILEARDYEVVTAFSIQEANDAIQDFDAQVALLDIRLGTDSGIDLLANLLTTNPDMLCVMMTAYVEIETTIEALHKGAYDYLRKPIEIKDLLATLDRCFEKHELRQQKEDAEENLKRRNVELSEINSRLKAIVSTTKTLGTCNRFEQFGKMLLIEFSQNMAAEGGSLYFFNESEFILAHSIDPGHAPDVLPFPLEENSLFAKALASRRPYLIRDLQQKNENCSSGWGGYKNGSLLIVPIVDDNNKVLGLISLHNKTVPPFTEQDREIALILANYSCETIRATKALNDLRQSEEKFRTLAENVPGVIYLCENDEYWSMLYLNDEIENLTGYWKEDFLTNRISLAELIHPEDKTFVNEKVEKALAEKTQFHIVYRVKHKSGSWRWVNEVGIGIYSGDQVEMLEGFLNDITERKLVETALEESEKKHQAICNNSLTGIFIHQNGVLSYINPRMMEILGYQNENAACFIGKNIINYVHEDDKQIVMDRATKRLAGEKHNAQYEVRLINKQGEVVWVEILVTVLEQDDEIALMGNTIDISDRKQAEEEYRALEEQLRQSQKMEAIGRLAGGVAHDFNNILTGINGYSEMALSTLDPDDPLYADLSEIRKAGKRAAGLTNQLLAFSRKQVISPKVIQVNEIIAQSKKMLGRIIGEDIDFVFSPAVDLGNIKADPSQIDQILINLATNSRDAMPIGGKIIVETKNIYIDQRLKRKHPDIPEGKYAAILFTDNGHGMDKDTLSRVFEPFFTTKEVGAGTGLGLATVYGIVKQNKGSIEIHSGPEEGTSILIYFPTVEKEPAEAIQKKESGLPTGTETILLVEDEDMVRKLAKKILTRYGYSIMEAHDGKDALLQCEMQSGKIDLVLTDVIMPNMNGKDLYDRLRTIKPNLKVLYMSGYTEDVIANQGVLDKGTLFIQKPFTIEELANKVRKALDE